jgi:hypothetical protein
LSSDIITPKDIYEIAKSKGTRLKKLEKHLVIDANHFVQYAIDIIKDRFYDYEIDFLNSIDSDNYLFLIKYTKVLVKRRWDLAEKKLLSLHIPNVFVIYCQEVIGGRWKEIEDILVSDSNCCYMYAREVLKSRFKIGESKIQESDVLSYLYIKEVVKEPLEIFHDKLLDSKYKENYISFLKNTGKIERLL